MIRNTDEYMMADGSPRYGIRIGDGLVATAAEKPAPAPSTPGSVLAQAQHLQGLQLGIAARLRHTQGVVTGDEALIAAARGEHPAEWKSAEKLVAQQLGSPAKWASTTSTASQWSVIVERRRQGLAIDDVRSLAGTITLTILPALLGIAAVIANLNLLIAMGASLVVFLAVRPARLSLGRRCNFIEGLGMAAVQRAMMWDDIVSATFLEALTSKEIPVDPGTSRALMRGWQHLSRTARAVDELSEPGAS